MQVKQRKMFLMNVCCDVKEETDLHNHINYFADVNNININNDN